MAYRRCLNSLLLRHLPKFIASTHPSLHSLKFPSFQTLCLISNPQFHAHLIHFSNFSSHTKPPKNPNFTDQEEGDEDEDEDEEEEEEEEEEESDMEGNDEGENGQASNSKIERAYSIEEKMKEAAEIGYRVIGPLDGSERVFKKYEPVFAVVQIGSHQFKVSNGDYIYTERLKFCEVNDKLILNKVLLLGSQSQTIIGRPIVPDAAVHAVVEEHGLDAKVIIFKKKRRKNYRRTKGHRQELSRLRITDIQGIEKPEEPPSGKKKASSNTVEKVPVAA
ncbi:Large ribosomal subunit protein bL21m-like protein [Drosera capensis]